jgi:hypothetical protein
MVEPTGVEVVEETAVGVAGEAGAELTTTAGVGDLCEWVC